MDSENMHFPLHHGVTEAGNGLDGRIKSAVGIGSLLCEGFGDTIRVSLTEKSEEEIEAGTKGVESHNQEQSHHSYKPSAHSHTLSALLFTVMSGGTT